MSTTPLTIEQFGATVKKKYPAYASKSDAEVGQAMLKKYPQYASRVTPPSPTVDWRDALTRIQPHQPIHSVADAGREAVRGVGNIGAGGLGVLLRPISTVEGMASAGRHPINTAKALYQSAKTQPLETAESMIGQAGATAGLGEAGGAVVRGAGEAIPKVARGTLRSITNTGAAEARELVTKTAKENAEATVKADTKNAEAAAQRPLDLKKHFEKTQAAKAENAAPAAAEARKAALTQGVEHLDTQFKTDLQATEKTVRAKANAQYNAVRAATKDQTVSSADLASAVKAAEKNISGSSENLKVFRDILSKHPEGEPDAIEYQGAQIPKGHPLYDVLREQGGTAGNPATFSDLQGYYTELGKDLAKGNLPDDVFRSIRDLHSSIGDLMQGMADRSGVGPQLTQARAFYRDYLNTFRDSKSPIRKALDATERGQAIKAFQGKDQTGIEALAKYDPKLAQRAAAIRSAQAEAKSIHPSTAKLKALPKLSPKPEPVQPEITKLGPAELQEQKKADILKRAKSFRNYSKFGNVYFAGSAIRDALGGNITGALKSVLEGAIYTAGTQAAGALLESPKVLEWLSSPTVSDLAELAKLPPEQRTQAAQQIKQVADAARADGKPVSPKIYALVGGGVASALRPATVSTGTTSGNPSTPPQ